MHILTYGLSADKLAGIEMFLINMNKYMSKDCIFDYVIEHDTVMGESTIHQAAIDEKGGRVYYVAPKRDIAQNIRDWKKLLKEHEYSVAYFNMYSLSWFIPIALCKKEGMKVFVHSHNAGIHNCGLVLKVLHQVGRFWLRHINVERLTNSQLSSKYMFCDPTAGRIIHNAISVDRFRFCNEIRNIMRDQLGVMGKNVYGFCGRLVYEKNPQYLIAVFEKIQKIDKNATLIVIGDGDIANLKKSISEKGLSEKVILLGNVKNVEDYYQAMDVFLLPSLYEGLGLVLIEAQTAGLPCITSAGVVPQEAKVTELLIYIPLDRPDRWVKVAMEMANRVINREKYSKIVEDSNYNIMKEALKLEKILLGRT